MRYEPAFSLSLLRRLFAVRVEAVTKARIGRISADHIIRCIRKLPKAGDHVVSCCILTDASVAPACRLRPVLENGAWIVLRMLGFC